MKRRGLGAGLLGLGAGSNVDDIPAATEETIREIPVERIDRSPYQPRVELDPDELAELAASIEEEGVHQPILVRPMPEGRYELIAGERRLEASKIAGKPTVPSRVRQVDDATSALIGWVENAQRENLSAWENARGLATLREVFRQAERPCSLRDLSKATGKALGWVSEHLQVHDQVGLAAADLDVPVQTLNGELSKIPHATLIQAIRDGRAAEIVAEAAGLEPSPAEGGGGVVEARATAQQAVPQWKFSERAGRVSIKLDRPVSQLEPEEARTLLQRLRPLVRAIEQRAKEGRNDR